MNDRLRVAVVAVQQQTGSTECGVMAIANAYHGICGDDLAKVRFAEVDSMRNHLSRYDDSYCMIYCSAETIHDISVIHDIVITQVL